MSGAVGVDMTPLRRNTVASAGESVRDRWWMLLLLVALPGNSLNIRAFLTAINFFLSDISDFQ